MAPFAGFPDDSKYTPVPNLLFGSLLEEIDDPVALKCFLRVLWLHSEKRGARNVLTRDELLADRTLARVVSTPGSSTEAALEFVLDRTVRLGLLMHFKVDSDSGLYEVYVPNTRNGRRAAQNLKDSRPDLTITEVQRDAPEAATKPNIFTLYEKNIGVITSSIADVLKAAEEEYPEAWIEEAFLEAVRGNKRNWRYIEAILRRWNTEGKGDGEHRGHSEKVDARERIRRYGFPGT